MVHLVGLQDIFQSVVYIYPYGVGNVQLLKDKKPVK